MTEVFERSGPDPAVLSTTERIRRAALSSFAAHGSAATSLRAVAAAAGVSLGLVQHHFGVKAKLIEAVDDYVFELITEIASLPASAPPADSLADIGNRITTIMSEHPDVVSYLGRALVDGSPMGARLFDAIATSGRRRWQQRMDNGEVREDVDLTWAALNSLVLALGVVTLRGHLERQVPGAFSDPGELQRWQGAVESLLRNGLFRPSVVDR